MAKKVFKPGGHKGKLHRELGIKEGTKIPAKRLKAAEHSKKPAVRRDAIRARDHEEVEPQGQEVEILVPKNEAW